MLTGRVDDREAQDLLSRLYKKAGNLHPEMQEIGAIGRRSMLKNFEVGGRYSQPGSWRGGARRWKPLKDQTLLGRDARWDKKGGRFRLPPDRRRRRGILRVSAQLQNSLNYRATGSSIKWGSNKAQAAIQNFGGTTRPHKITARHKKALSWVNGPGPLKSVNHPGSKIPARPYAVLQDEDMLLIKQMLQERLLKSRG